MTCFTFRKRRGADEGEVSGFKPHREGMKSVQGILLVSSYQSQACMETSFQCWGKNKREKIMTIKLKPFACPCDDTKVKMDQIKLNFIIEAYLIM